MSIVERHCTPDGLLTLIVERHEEGDVSLGFEGFAWHTHADILASLSGLSSDDAVRRYVDDLLAERSVIAIARVGEEIRDVWVTDRAFEDKYKPDGETLEFRYWNGLTSIR
jgi:hypothetical protein